METNESLSEGQNETPVIELNPEQSRIWEENHKTIMDCIRHYMQSNYQTPTVTFISQKTGISRPTVRKHIRDFSAQPNFQEHATIYKFMTTDILRQLYSQSMYGDVRAARLYLELMGVIKGNTLVENNFINVPPRSLRLGDVEITEELFNKLKPETKEKLEETLREGIEQMKSGGLPLKNFQNESSD